MGTVVRFVDHAREGVGRFRIQTGRAKRILTGHSNARDRTAQLVGLINGGRSRNRTDNPSIKSRRLRPGVPLSSTEYRGQFGPKWSPFGARLDQILDQAAANR